ncbi:D-amino-acid transaminase [Thiorhodospira sibirica]|uniref:D-amino-acid transaminase n=1 Tax=Thiorhodospira sibirica TaxID=154347 RepID=UPI00022C33F3|nr:D-amino-acid transaminase [Thiorhodospira sibirica]
MTHPASVVYLNGAFLDRSQACISVLDRGFVFGDGVYEVIPCYGGHLFHPQSHLHRLARSLEAVRIKAPLSDAQWLEVFTSLLARNPGGDRSIYLQVTRGVAPRNHAFPSAEVSPTVFAMVDPITPVPAAFLRDGVAAITLADQRWQRCDIKAITLLANVLARQEAIEAGAVEAILVRDDVATEGAASNLFMVVDNAVLTPPKDHQLLPGITRDVVVYLAQQLDIPVKETPITLDALRRADEIWLTSSTKDILPVTRLDEQPVGNGQPGPLWQRVYRAYIDYKHQGVF